MTTVPVPPPPRGLRALATRLELVLFPLGWEQPPIFVGVDESGELQLLLAPEGADDPIDDLVGFTAPPEWCAVGLISSGRVSDLRTEGGRAYGVRTEPERRARLGHFVDRAGEVVSFLRLGDDPPSFREGPCVGRVDDLCRRSLGLATAPPEVAVAVWWASCWLDAVLEAAADDPTRVTTWDRVAALHPVVAHTDGPSPDEGVGHELASIPALVDAGRWLADQGSWEALREVAASGSRPWRGVAPAAARWMDEGMFSRWVLADVPPLGVLRAAVVQVLPGEVAAGVDEALDGWGLP